MDTESVSELSSGTKTINGNEEIADDGDNTRAWYNITSTDIFKNRQNPRNGIDCFFSEASFNQIMGPGPSFKEKLLSQIARIKFEQQKPKGPGPNKTNSKMLDKKTSSSDVKHSKGAQVNHLPSVLFVSAGFQNEVVKDSLAVSSESASQVLNSSRSNGTLGKDLKNKVDTSNLAVSSESVSQALNSNKSKGTRGKDLKNKVVLDTSKLSVKCATLEQDVNTNMTVNKNMNKSLTVDSASTVRSNKQAQPSNIATFSYSEIPDQHKNEPSLNSSDSVDDMDTQDVKNVSTVSAPIEKPICDALNESEVFSNVDSICRNKKSKTRKNNKVALDTAILSNSDGLKAGELEKNIDNSIANIPRDSEDSLLNSVPATSLSTDMSSIEKSVKITRRTTRASISCLNSTSSDAAYCEIASSASAISTSTGGTTCAPISLDTKESISNVSSQHSKQSDLDPRTEDLKCTALKEHISVVSLPMQQNLNNTAEVTSANSSYSDNRTSSENLKGTANDNTAENVLSKDNESVSILQNDLHSDEEMPLTLDIPEVPEQNLQAPLLDGNLVKDENPQSPSHDTQELCLISHQAPLLDGNLVKDENPQSPSHDTQELCLISHQAPLLDGDLVKDENPQSPSHDTLELCLISHQVPLLDGHLVQDENPQSPSHDTQELCLVMRSLSSDDDDDDDDYNNFKDSTSSIVGKLPHIEDALKKNHLDASASLDNQPAALVVMSGNNATISTSNPPNDVHDSGSSSYSFLSAQVNNKESDNATGQYQTGTQACSLENNMPDIQNMEMQTLSDYQESNQAALLNIPSENGANWQATAAPALSDVDIPIFCVKEASPQPVKLTKSTTSKQENKKLLESANKGANRSFSEIGRAEDAATKQDETKNINFKKSSLTKEEHATYLKLYNKYMQLFMHSGPPPVISELQCREIASFEMLQKRVQAEQAEFQNYLLQNAKKNPQSYTFLRTVARNYSASKAKAYRMKLNQGSRFKQTCDYLIPLCMEASPAVLEFQQALLEVGIPPSIKLPDLQGGQKPVPIEYNIRQIENSFPRNTKSNVPGFTHHETVSLDINVKSLATKYDFQVVMASSVMKCLLDNHGPEFERVWNIPVRVQNHNVDDGEKKTIVYLDKPVFENDLHVKDYSRLFHKYALRTFVSHPKRKPVPITKKYQQFIHTEKPCEIDDPFDMSSSNVDNLETFGAGYSNLLKKKQTPPEDENVKSVVTERDAEKTNTWYPKRLRSSRKYKSWDEITDSDNQLVAEKPSDSLGNIPSVLKKGLQKKSGLSETVKNVAKLSGNDSESDCEPVKKRAKMDQAGECKDSEKIIHTSSSSVVMENSLLVETDDSPQSPEADHTEPFNNTQSPLSPNASPSSPSAVDENCSSRFMIPLSPVREIPSSPVRLFPPSALPEESILKSQPIATSLPCRRSPRTKASKSESPGSATSASQKVSGVTEKSRNTEGVKNKLFTPLDSILGPSFGQLERRNSHDLPKEDPSIYLPPTEVHSSLVYNLWTLGSLNVLIRTRCHGILKDLKKSRKVYFSPKMEYQSCYGLEQVTVSEVARDWTACFIRPNTNLLRARINAFNSEILLFEELETGQILRSSLNFKPEIGFQFVDRVLQSLVKLQPGYYLLSHEPGDNFCGLRSSQHNVKHPIEKTAPLMMRKSNRENRLPWIPIDPTLLLPSHIANNRIPATFLPKDVILKNNSGGPNKRNDHNSTNNVNNNKQGGGWSNVNKNKQGGGWSNVNKNKQGGGWRKFNDKTRGGRKNKN